YLPGRLPCCRVDETDIFIVWRSRQPTWPTFNSVYPRFRRSEAQKIFLFCSAKPQERAKGPPGAGHRDPKNTPKQTKSEQKGQQCLPCAQLTLSLLDCVPITFTQPKAEQGNQSTRAVCSTPRGPTGCRLHTRAHARRRAPVPHTRQGRPLPALGHRQGLTGSLRALYELGCGYCE